MQKIFELWLPIIAIVISLVSLIISYFSHRIGHKSFELNLAPILKIKFLVDRNMKDYKISLLNDGPNIIYDIKIRFIRRLISQDFDPISTLRSKNDWNYIQSLRKEESKVFHIPNDEIERAFQGENMSAIKPIGSALTFLISFRREPDRKKYREAKTIFFFRDSQTNEIGDFDPDEFGLNYWTNAANKLGAIDQDYDF